MSHEEVPQEDHENQEEYVDLNDIAEEVADDHGPAPEDDNDDNDMDMDGQEDQEESIEIDLANNSWTYFDQHKDSIFTVFHTLPCLWWSPEEATTQHTCGQHTHNRLALSVSFWVTRRAWFAVASQATESSWSLVT